MMPPGSWFKLNSRIMVARRSGRPGEPAKRFWMGFCSTQKVERCERLTPASQSTQRDNPNEAILVLHDGSVRFGQQNRDRALPADEIERVVMNALNERLADMRWLADQISGQVGETTAVCILRTIEQRVVEEA